jgi:hypothetical protein
MGRFPAPMLVISEPAAAGEVVLAPRCAAAVVPCASFLPTSVHRFSKLISTASPARYSASSPCRRDRQWKRSTIWRHGTRSLSGGPLNETADGIGAAPS